MRVARSTAELEQVPRAVAVGTFDGVHLGHRALIAATIEAAGRRDLASVAITWDRHPNVTLRPERIPPMLSSPARKLELLAAARLDKTVVVPFDREFSSWPPEKFAAVVLAETVRAEVVVIGEGWRFGHKATGDIDLLEKLGIELGFEVRTVTLTDVAGGPVSSSRVREAISLADLGLARILLGRPFDIDGTVTTGAGRGVELGFPTANLVTEEGLLIPPRGVYAGRACVAGIWYATAVNVGVNPTFGGDPEKTPLQIEAFLLDFSGDLYGATVRVEFWERLRDERKFRSAGELVEQMRRDVEATRELGLKPG